MIVPSGSLVRNFAFIPIQFFWQGLLCCKQFQGYERTPEGMVLRFIIRGELGESEVAEAVMTVSALYGFMLSEIKHSLTYLSKTPPGKSTQSFGDSLIDLSLPRAVMNLPCCTSTRLQNSYKITFTRILTFSTLDCVHAITSSDNSTLSNQLNAHPSAFPFLLLYVMLLPNTNPLNTMPSLHPIKQVHIA